MTDYSRLVKAYDIRGEVPTQLNPVIAERIGTLFIRLTEAPCVVVARDMRATSPEPRPSPPGPTPPEPM
jgi:phosphomannomutase